MNDDQAARSAETLSPREMTEEEIVAELERQIGARLGGLFRLCLEFRSRLNEPGVAHVCAFAAREVLNTLLRESAEGRDSGRRPQLQTPEFKALCRGTRDLTGPDFEIAARRVINSVLEEIDGDAFGVRLARVLDLPPAHVALDPWKSLSRTLGASHHHGQREPDLPRLGEAIDLLVGLLRVALAPYYDVEAETAALLSIDAPSRNDIARLKRQLGRRRQREVFFRGLDRKGWFQPLRDAGFFREVPDVEEVDGGWRARPWPEGQYLVRIANLIPGEIADLVAGISPANRNPVVWSTVVEIAGHLTRETVAQVVGRLVDVVRRRKSRAYWMVDLVELLPMLQAVGAEEAAFGLATALLAMRMPVAAKPGDTFEALLRGPGFTSVLDAHEVQTFSDKAIPVLAKSNPARLLALLSELVDAVDAWYGTRDGDAGDSPRDNSDSWAGDPDHLEVGGRPETAPAGLFWRATHLVAEASDFGAKTAWNALATGSCYFHDRLRFSLLVKHGELLAAEEEAFALSPGLLQRASFQRREIARWLRTRYSHLSEMARDALRHQLLAGPPFPERDEKAIKIEAEEETRNLEKEREELTRAWQRRWLELFEDTLPADLAAFAMDIGYEPRVPTHEERSLRETGGYFTVGARAEVSPISDDDLQRLHAHDAVRRMLEWEEGTSVSLHSPTRLGLNYSVRQHASGRPAWGLAVLEALRDTVDGPRVCDSVAMIAEGLVSAISRQPDEMAWAEQAAPEILYWLDRLQPLERESDAAAALAALARLADSLADQDTFSPRDAEAIWHQLANALRVILERERANVEAESPRPQRSGGLSYAVTTFPDALLAVAMRSVRVTEVDGKQSIPVYLTDAFPSVLAILWRVGGDDGRNVRAAIGRRLPQLHLLAPQWVADELRAELGDLPHRDRPILLWENWLRYARPYPDMFASLRSVLRDGAIALRSRRERDRAADSAAGGLATQAIWALLFGWCALGDDDEFVETVFKNLPPETARHAYWTVFRGFADTDGDPDPHIIARAIGFWRWRLEVLDGAGNDGGDRVPIEAEALLWFIQMKAIPAATRIELGVRTVAHNAKRPQGLWSVWDAVAELAVAEPELIVPLLAALVELTERMEIRSLPTGDVRAAFEVALVAADDVGRAVLIRLIHELGEIGGPDLHDLL